MEVIFAIWGYAVQIYCDFSGYTDMAIGIALLLGFRFPDNFDAPYIATSIRDFWRRWHITLSRGLRDYLYIPLGGNRGSRLATYRNLMLTMLLGGLWHGASWTFVIWGALHGGAMVVEHAQIDRRRRQHLPEPELRGWRLAVRRFLIFQFVCLAWVFFRSTSLAAAWAVLWRAFTAWVRRRRSHRGSSWPSVWASVCSTCPARPPPESWRHSTDCSRPSRGS